MTLNASATSDKYLVFAGRLRQRSGFVNQSYGVETALLLASRAVEGKGEALIDDQKRI